MNNVMRVRGPGELVAAIPHLLGFVPEDSVVCVPLGGGGPVARLDHPHQPEDIGPAAAVLAAPYLRDRLDVAVVLLTDDRAAAQKMSHALRRRPVGHVRVPLVLWVDGSTWTDLTTGESGEVPEATRKQLAAEAVFVGRRLPAKSREALAVEVQPDPVRVAAVAQHLLHAMPSTGRLLEARHGEDEADWVRATVGGFCETQRPLDDATAARPLVPDGRALGLWAHRTWSSMLETWTRTRTPALHTPLSSA